MQIRLNLVVALAAAQIAFLSGIDALEPKVRCHCLAVFDEKNKKKVFLIVFYPKKCFASGFVCLCGSINPLLLPGWIRLDVF